MKVFLFIIYYSLKERLLPTLMLTSVCIVPSLSYTSFFLLVGWDTRETRTLDGTLQKLELVV